MMRRVELAVDTICIVCIIALLWWLIVGYVIFVLSLKSRESNSLFKKDDEKVRNIDLGCAKFYEQEMIISKDNTRLNCHYAYSDEKKTWVICIHGYGGKATGMVEYAEMFRNFGFNVLSIDLRGHGDSKGKYYTLGIYDSEDVILWSKWLKEKFNANKIVLFGISMGGATALMTAAKKPGLYSLVITDSAPSDFIQMFKRILKHRMGPIANIFLPALSLYTRLLAKYHLDDAAARKYVSSISAPVLYIHGKCDGLVPLEMMHELYEKTKSDKKKLVVPDADHTGALNEDPILYQKTVFDFLMAYDIL